MVRTIRNTPRRGLKSAIGCEGIGLHSGASVHLRLLPAAAGSGVAFHRSDLGAVIPARHDHVADTRLSTVLADPARPEIRVATVEHVMAALAGAGIDDAVVELDGPEVPVLDGSAAEFSFLIACAGIIETGPMRDRIEVLRPVRAADGAAFAELHPAEPFAQDRFNMTLAIEFPARAIGRQTLSLDLTPERFTRELARARTFTMEAEIRALHEAGLALGGSLGNAVVVNDDKVLNPEGLRFADEFVRHKLLDVVGDLALAGALISGRFIGNRSGHRLNNMLLHALFADPANYRYIPGLSGMIEAVAA
jgi:UDP-3-O-[3-hydroxymyristoyl] N-acetylglucosamine deacetylase